MTSCILTVAMTIVCSNVHPATPTEAVRVLQTSVPQFVAPLKIEPRGRDSPAPLYNPYWPFSTKLDVHRPINPEPSGWRTVTTFTPREGPPLTSFDGAPLPLSYIVR